MTIGETSLIFSPIPGASAPEESFLQVGSLTAVGNTVGDQGGEGLGLEIMKELEAVEIHHPNSGVSSPMVG